MMTDTAYEVDVAVAFAAELVAGTPFYAPEIEHTEAVHFADQPATLVVFRFCDCLGAAIVVGSKTAVDRAIQEARATGRPLTLWARADMPWYSYGPLKLLSGSIVPSQSGGVPAYA